MITVVNYSAPLRLPQPWRWAPDCPACGHVHTARLSRMRAQYRRKQRGWR